MAQTMLKSDFPVHNVRKYLEPGPVVLVSSRWKNRSDIMTMGWHSVMEFSPSLVGCVIAGGNYSFDLIRGSGECVINVPTADLVDTVVAIGNSTGAEVDKFSQYGLTAQEATRVGAPLIGECHASFECRLYDDALVDKYNFFIFEIVKAHVAKSQEYPSLLHYTGDGVFIVSQHRMIDKAAEFRPEML